MIVGDSKTCFSCGACVQGCPHKCIQWEQGEFGFSYPKVDEDRCVKCGICDRVCPIGKKVQKPAEQEIYAGIIKDAAILEQSTSGGIFSALATSVLDSGGCVYGCSMEDGFRVCHIRISSSKDLCKLRGSKYVQSNTRDIFLEVKKDLKNGNEVLFSGTPCQIAALIGFVGTNNKNLITVDVVCHGVASQPYFDKFVDYLSKSSQELNKIEFRNKRFVGWSCGGVLSYQKKDVPFYNYNQYYYSYFLSGEIYRQSCYSCPYANLNRVSDITLGDFWGVENLNTGINTMRGCSLILVNTEKGRNIMLNVKNNIVLAPVLANDAVRLNKQLSHPTEYKAVREKRLEEFNELSGIEIQRIFVKTHIKTLLMGRIKSLIPYRWKTKLRKLL